MNRPPVPRTPPPTFAALRHPNYRLWFWGQMTSLFGTWMQSTALGFLVFDLTRSPSWLGYTAFTSGIAIWLFMLFGGVVADRLPRRTLLVCTQTYLMLLAFLLALLTFLRLVQPWHVLALSFLLGVGNAFDAPARQSFLLELVEREDLTNAVALNSTMFNVAMAVGPAGGGLLYAFVGPGWCFTLNGLSFVAVIASLLRMRLAPPPLPRLRTRALAELKEGLRYAAGHGSIRLLIALAMVTGLFGFCFATLFPAWAVHVLNGDAVTNGWLVSARGIGSLAGSLLLASAGSALVRGRQMAVFSLLFPASLLLFSLLRSPLLSLAAVGAIGFTLVSLQNLLNSLLQTLSSDRLRGRVMSLHMLCFFGLIPIGGLLAGTAAEHFGEPAAVAASALLTLACMALIHLAAPRLRALR